MDFVIDTSSSDTEDDLEYEPPPRKRKIYRPRINFEWDRMLRAKDFIGRFRLSHAGIENIIQRVGRRLQHDTDRNMALSPAQQILLAIRYLAGGDRMLLVGDGHGPAKATVSRSVHAFVDALNDEYFHDIVKWPENLDAVVAGFYKIAHVPSCIGAIDGCHILIKRPAQDEYQYVNGRSNKHSINTMMVSGPKYYVYYLSAKRPGAVNDQRVLRLSTLARRFERNDWPQFPNAVLVGDGGYKLSSWLMTPVSSPHRDLTDAEERFNARHRRTRMRIECTFGIMKKRFGCLEKLRLTPRFAASVIKSCVILHNMALREEPVPQWEIDEIMREIEERERNAPEVEEIEDAGERDEAGLRRQAELVAFFGR